MKPLLLGALLLAATTALASAQSCRQTAGAAKAQELVHQCTQVSQATHPPCNAANPCDMITDEITHGCGELREARMATPAFCARYSR